MTGKAYFALPAITGQGSFLILTKLDLLRGGEQLDQMGFANVAQLVFGFYKMVAGIEIAVMLQGYRLAARFREYADRAPSPDPVSQGRVKMLDVNLPHIGFHPFIENGDKEA